MGLFDKLKRAVFSGSPDDEGRQPSSTAERLNWLPPDKQRPDQSLAARSDGPGHSRGGPAHVKHLARTLMSRHPLGMPEHETVRQAAAAEGLDPDAIWHQIEADRAWSPPIVKPRKVNPRSLRVIDLSSLDAIRMRIKGSAYSVSDTERVRQGGSAYLLIREPDNDADPQAVAVYGMRGLRVGYVSTSRAASTSPLLAQLDADAFRVSGAGAVAGSIVLWVDLPKLGPLRKFVQQTAQRGPSGG